MQTILLLIVVLVGISIIGMIMIKNYASEQFVGNNTKSEFSKNIQTIVSSEDTPKKMILLFAITLTLPIAFSFGFICGTIVRAVNKSFGRK